MGDGVGEIVGEVVGVTVGEPVGDTVGSVPALPEPLPDEQLLMKKNAMRIMVMSSVTLKVLDLISIPLSNYNSY